MSLWGLSFQVHLWVLPHQLSCDDNSADWWSLTVLLPCQVAVICLKLVCSEYHLCSEMWKWYVNIPQTCTAVKLHSPPHALKKKKRIQSFTPPHGEESYIYTCCHQRENPAYYKNKASLIVDFTSNHRQQVFTDTFRVTRKPNVGGRRSDSYI